MVRWLCSSRLPCCGTDWSGADLRAVLSVTWPQWITACNWVWLSGGSGLVNENWAVFGNEQAGGERSNAMRPGQHTLMVIRNYFRFWQIQIKLYDLISTFLYDLLSRFRGGTSCLCFFLSHTFRMNPIMQIHMKLLFH